jgi:cytochrome c oxidase subunit 1
MGVTYYVLPLIGLREIAFPKLAAIQPYLFGFGVSVFSIAMMFVGGFGLSRRHWDIYGADAPFQVTYDPMVNVGMLVMVAGGIVMILGGALYCIIAVATLLIGKKVPA